MSSLEAFIVEDSAVIRDNLVAALEEMVPLKVVGTAEDEAAALSWLADPGHDCDIAIVDIYRVVQEGLTNVAKYARATQVDVRLIDRESVAVRSIQDDGVGFDPTRVPQAARGLAGMRFRVVSHGGRFDVVSRLGGGTTIEVRLPQRARTDTDTLPAA